jgi:hypothetical protein
MKRSLSYFLSLLLFIGILPGCTERIELELDETYSRLVVDGEFTDEIKAHKVRLTISGSYLGGDQDAPVRGATVKISDSLSTWILKENQQEPGSYYTDPSVCGKEGRTYTLDIELPDEINGHKRYTAISTIYPVYPLDSIGIRWLPQWEVWEIQCFAQDPPTRDFYMFDLLRNDTLLTDTVNERFVTDDLFYNGSYTNGVGIGYLSPSEGEDIMPGDKITVRMGRITEEYYNYHWEVISETGYNNPLFGGPPANIKGNISNGAMGFFSAYSVEMTSKIYEPAP